MLVLQSLKNLDRESSNQVLRNADEIVVLDEIVEINRQQFKRYDQMLPEKQIVLYSYHIILIMLVVLIEVEQDLQLHARLILELLLISDNFDRDCLAIGVVEAFEGLSEAAGAQELEHLEPVADVVLQRGFVVTVAIIVAIIINIHELQSLYLSLTWYLLLTYILIT